jgi:hypothetical protein
MTETIKAEFADDEVEIKAAQTAIDNKYANIQAAQIQTQARLKQQDHQMQREKMYHDSNNKERDRQSKEKQSQSKPSAK